MIRPRGLRAPDRWRPSVQLATILAISLVVCAILIVAASLGFDAYLQQRVLDQLQPPARRAIDALIAGREPAYADFQQLMKVQAQINSDALQRSYTALALFILCAAGGAFVVGRILLSRIGSGLEDVARAARAVAGGNLSVRARPMRWASAEEAGLIEDFNRMARALAEAERELRDSTAAIAHELRTPLTVLSGRLHGIKDGVFAAGPEQIESLLKQVDSLSRLVDDLRTLSLVQSGQPLLELAAIDLAEVTRSLLAAIKPDLIAAGLQPQADLRAAPMIGDATRLRQAMGAVLSNAMRYAPNSGVLRIETGLGPDGIFVRILDAGPGLSAESEARAFERFWRGDQSRARASGGSGLGLSVVRAIATAHHGRATLTSRDGGGTAFVLVLPPVQPPIAAVVNQISTQG